MKFEIIWSEFAEKQLDAIFEYHLEKAGYRIAKKLIQKIISEPNKLKNNPYIGQVEDLLKARKEIYRYLVCKNYKLIYSFDEKKERVKIIDVFDTRQNSIKIERSK